MRIVSLIMIAAFLSLSLHVSAGHVGEIHDGFSIVHHGEGTTEAEHASYERSDGFPHHHHFSSHPHDAVLIPTKSRVSVQRAPLIFAASVSSTPNRDRITIRDSLYSLAPPSNGVALHLSACVFLL